MVVDGTVFWMLYAFWQFGGLFGIDPKNPYVNWIFINGIPSFLAGLYLFSIDYIWIKINVLDNDHGHDMIRYKRDLNSAKMRFSSQIQEEPSETESEGPSIETMV